MKGGTGKLERDKVFGLYRGPVYLDITQVWVLLRGAVSRVRNWVGVTFSTYGLPGLPVVGGRAAFRGDALPVHFNPLLVYPVDQVVPWMGVFLFLILMVLTGICNHMFLRIGCLDSRSGIVCCADFKVGFCLGPNLCKVKKGLY